MKAELTEWQRNKFVSLFDLFDLNQDQVINESDLDGAMERLQIESGWPASSRVISHVSARWKLLVRSLFPSSPRLKVQNWLHYLEQTVKADRNARQENSNHRGSLDEVSQLLFLILDRDKDSKIDLQDFLILFHALGLNDRDAQASFEKLDPEQNGFLGKAEFEDLTLEYFHADRPESRGDWLFGDPLGSS